MLIHKEFFVFNVFFDKDTIFTVYNKIFVSEIIPQYDI